ncbi:MAG: methyltransferase domain-containing protein [Actinomycetota bacterium]|nr:methyltransferase domain-containing protein [Actinomycetota bacterium]
MRRPTSSTSTDSIEGGSAVAFYDTIGVGYASIRRPDPRLHTEISAALGAYGRVLNVGAGTGSYEPADRDVVAVEPSRLMIAQRPPDTGPPVLGVAELLPIASRSVDAAMAIFSIQHWSDIAAGIAEMVRVSRKSIVLVTIDTEALAAHWMVSEYAPEILDVHASGFPSISFLLDQLPGAMSTPWLVPTDCTDAFFVALWSRPELYLQPEVRAATSVWHQLPQETVDAVLARLADDLKTGRWDERHGELRTCPALDVGVRIVRADVGRSTGRVNR